MDQHRSNSSRSAAVEVAAAKHSPIDNQLACLDRSFTAHSPDLNVAQIERTKGQGTVIRMR